MDYIIIKADGSPYSFSDGEIVVYGMLFEAIFDTLPNEKIIPYDEYQKAPDRVYEKSLVTESDLEQAFKDADKYAGITGLPDFYQRYERIKKQISNL